MKTPKEFAANCPISISQYPQVLLAHGGGGKLMHRLIEDMFGPAFQNPLLDAKHDGAVFDVSKGRLAFTTDSYVVSPLVFPGGDIGSLAVNGTVNDLAMCGARPVYLSAGFIIEEGLPMETLWQIVVSMKNAAELANIQIVTGDTKVVDKGKGDGIFINTAGVGVVEHKSVIGPAAVRTNDVIILSGDIGRHAVAIMAAREGLEFESAIESDSAPVAKTVKELLAAGVDVHCLRDITRGGLASALVEIAEAARVQIHLDEASIPVREDVRGACEILGFDPLYLACEGRFVSFVPPDDSEEAMRILKRQQPDSDPRIIGRVTGQSGQDVVIKSVIGTTRIVDMLSGEQLPRIC